MGELDDLIANADRDITHGRRDSDIDRLAEGFSKALTAIAILCQEVGQSKEREKLLEARVSKVERRETW